MKRLMAHIRESDTDGRRAGGDKAWWWEASDVPSLAVRVQANTHARGVCYAEWYGGCAMY